MKKALRHNINKLYGMAFFQSAMIITAVFVPLMQRHGLSMTEVLKTQAVFALVIALCEVPSGYLADLWGRRNTIVLGALLCCLSFMWLVGADSYSDFVIYEIIMALGLSLNSGADLALLYDSQAKLHSLRNGNTENQSGGRHIARLVSIEGIAGGMGGIAATLLAMVSLDWVLWAQLIISIIVLLIALSLIEAPRNISVRSHRDNLQQVKEGLLRNPLVSRIALTIIMFGLAALYSFWLIQKYWELQSIPVHWFGVIWAGHCLLRGVMAMAAHNVERWLGTNRLMLLIAVLPIAGLLGMGLLGGWPGIAMGLLFPISRGLAMVVLTDGLNKRVAADFRATINSLVSLGTRGLFIVTGPMIGYLADTQGVQQTQLILAAIFIPLFGLVLLPLCKQINRQRPSTETV